MCQKFYADLTHPTSYPNGAVSYGSGMPFQQVHYAKVSNCPIEGTDLRLTCYQIGDADMAWAMPACTRYKGKYIRGFFTYREDGVVFCVLTGFITPALQEQMDRVTARNKIEDV